MFITKTPDFKKIVLAALTASIVLAPLASQAAPPDYAPAYGYRNKADKKADKAERKAAKKAGKVIRDRNQDGYDDRDRDRDGDLDEEDGFDYRETPRYQNQYGNNGYNNNGANDNYYYGNANTRDFRDANRNGIDDRYENSNGRGGVRTTLSGVVTRDLQGRRFEIRASNGRTYVVIARNNEPLRLTRGDTVQVFGRIFDNVRTQRNNDPYHNNRDNNRDNTRNNGRFNTNSFILADRVRITRNDDQNENGSRVSFTGRVLDVRNDRELVVRAENGRTYTLRSDNKLSSRINEGDRVSVTGRLRNNDVVDVSRIDLTDDRNDDNNNNDANDNNIDFRGRVQSSSNIFGQRILVVRADNGTAYRVRFNENTSFREGERVRVRGDLRNGIVFANDIDRD